MEALGMTHPVFGTSGLRGLASDLTQDCVARYTTAFVASCPTGGAVFLGRDLRNSSLRIAESVVWTLRQSGHQVLDCGAVPTPALALAASNAGAAAIMVTGSHIPSDRNGLKFYTPSGEITKEQERAILTFPVAPFVEGPEAEDVDVTDSYITRYVTAFGLNALAGMRIGVWSHSAVGRDVLCTTLTRLGAEVREFGRSATFVPVDTEAIDTDTRRRLAGWSLGLDALVSTDGDGDRPLLVDERGNVVPGDILGQITAQALRAATVVTPVSSNSGVEELGFANVLRTRIGSPHVIAAMTGQGRCVGYEANGGFLLGFEAEGPAGPLPKLMTRDSLLPLLVTLIESRGRGVSARTAQEPRRFTATDRLVVVPTERSKALVDRLTRDPQAAGAAVVAVDMTDGPRMRLVDGSILHVRPSGNAPELRIYTEADTPAAAKALLDSAASRITSLLTSG